MIIANLQELDTSDGVQVRVYYESLRSALWAERSSWDAMYRQLARFVLPRNQRFVYSDTDNGQRLDYSIVDNTATIAHRTLRAGLSAGICSPTRKWLTLKTDDRKLNERREVKIWLEETEKILGDAQLKSNFYQTMHNAFGELGLYGTNAFTVLEDDKDDFRCYPWPIGSYCIAGDDTCRIDLFMRIVQMTVRQIVEKFGFNSCSQSVQNMYTNNSGGNKETWYPVVNVVHPNRYFGGKQLLPDHKPWISVWYEMGSFGNEKQSKGNFGLLRKSGYWECPAVASRWDVVGEDFYGISPGMDALGDTMGLQLLQKRKQEAIDKMVKPPLLASPALINQKVSLLPGDITYADLRDGNAGVRPLYEMRFDVADAVVDIQDHHRRIDDAFYKSLFLMLSSSDRREVTAEEIRAKQEEKMLVLGPVLERSNGELLAPAVMRQLAILNRRGKLPPPPEAMKGKKLSVEFSSILAQVQRMMGVANLDRFMATVGQEAAVNQGVFDKVDLDEVVNQYADMLGVSPKVLRSEEATAAIRQDKAQQAKQAAQAENAKNLAAAAQNLSQTDTSGQNGLTDLIRGNTGLGA